MQQRYRQVCNNRSLGDFIAENSQTIFGLILTFGLMMLPTYLLALALSCVLMQHFQ